MTDRTTIEIDPALSAGVEALVREGRYGDETEFVNAAVRLKLWLEQPPGDGDDGGAPPLMAFFEAPRGRALLRELLREAREG